MCSAKSIFAYMFLISKTETASEIIISYIRLLRLLKSNRFYSYTIIKLLFF